MADAMYAPVVTRFMTYDVKLEPRLKAYADMIMGLPEMANGSRPPRPSPPTSKSSRSNIRQRSCLFERLKPRAALLNLLPSGALAEPASPRRRSRPENRSTRFRPPTNGFDVLAAANDFAAVQRGWLDFRIAQ